MVAGGFFWLATAVPPTTKPPGHWAPEGCWRVGCETLALVVPTVWSSHGSGVAVGARG